MVILVTYIIKYFTMEAVSLVCVLALDLTSGTMCTVAPIGLLYTAPFLSHSVDKARVHRNKHNFLQFGSKLKARNMKFSRHVQ